MTLRTTAVVLLDWIASWFADTLIEDQRDAIAVFQIPGLKGDYELLPPHRGFWNQLIAVSARTCWLDFS